LSKSLKLSSPSSTHDDRTLRALLAPKKIGSGAAGNGAGAFGEVDCVSKRENNCNGCARFLRLA